MVIKNCLDEYFRLMEERPSLFICGSLPIISDRALLERYMEESGKQLGVIYKSEFNCLVVDLLDDGGRLVTYERIIPSATNRGVVCIPVFKDGVILIRQFRHAIREEQLCFPRGFGEDGLESCNNAKKELFEEIGAVVSSVEKIGEIVADSGLSSGRCDVFLCRIDGYSPDRHDEGIIDTELYSFDRVKEMISSERINDGFTLSAFMLLEAKGFLK